MKQFQNEMEKEANRRLCVRKGLQGCDRGHFIVPITTTKSRAPKQNITTQAWCYRFSNLFGCKD